MESIEFVLNGKPVSIRRHPSARLLDVLREDFGLKGTKEGCGEGECGACAVLIDHRIVNSCCYPLAYARGKRITTIEGFAGTPRYEAIARAMGEEGGVQCGICTPGMIIAAESLLDENPKPSEEEIRVGLSGNLCRCTGYNMIVKAIRRAAKEGEGLW